MRLAINVVAHNPEVKPDKIESRRLLEHGWSEAVVEFLQPENHPDERPAASTDESPPLTSVGQR